jgi:two-component system KDP operon response regulator KdpE
MTGKKILIIDDEAGIRKYLSMALTSAQYLVEEAESGGLGLLKLNEARPDLVILDLGLPDIPGKDVLNFIRKQSQVPILILTAHSSEEEKVALLDFGADDYLTKPFGINELLARLRVMLRHSSPSVHHKEVMLSGSMARPSNLPKLSTNFCLIWRNSREDLLRRSNC